MNGARREVSIRQVRIVLVVLGAIAGGLLMLRREPPPQDSVDPGQGQTQQQTPDAPSGPSQDLDFSAGLTEAGEDWRTAATLGEPIDVSDIEVALEEADRALAEGRLVNPPGDNALILYLAILRADPRNQAAREGADAIGVELQSRLETALVERDLQAAEQLIPTLDQIWPGDPGIHEMAERFSRERRAEILVQEAREDLELGRFVQPSGNNALARLLRARQLDPGKPGLSELLANLERQLVDRALEAARQDNFSVAENWIAWAERVRGGSTGVAQASSSIAQRKQDQVVEIMARAREAMQAGQFDDARADIERLRRLGGTDAMAASLREDLRRSRLYGNFRPRQIFRDDLRNGELGPNMVVIPKGSFTMGSRPEEPGHTSFEEPRHEVRFANGFALSSTEITVGQFRQFVESTGYTTEAEREGYASVYNAKSGRLSRRRGVSWRDGYDGRGTSDQEPVVHVSWNDASEYAAWLAAQTGEAYRLPTEAEFEFAQRGGTETSFWWGDGDPEFEVENLTGDGDRSPYRGTWDEFFEDYDDGYWGPAPVGQFEPNGFLLFDMAGNVQEWTIDCWHDSYARAPTDGSAWVNRGCTRRVVRGGFWGGAPETARSAFRTGLRADQRGSSLGFRIARDLVMTAQRPGTTVD